MIELFDSPYDEPLPSADVLSEFQPDMRVAFILMDKFTLAPVTGLVESLRFAADQSFRSHQLYCRWDWITINDEPILASCGLSINPTKAFDLHSLKTEYDYVVLAGGLLSETRQPSEQLLYVVKEVHAAKIPLIALCSSSFVLGNAGILDGRKCAVHFAIRDEFMRRFPKAIALVDKSYAEDKGVFTCPGGIAIDLAANLIRHHCGDVRAQKGLEYLLINNEKNWFNPHKAAVFESPDIYENVLVSKAIAYMSDNLSAHVTLKQVAEYARTSPRQLHRAFVASTGEAPANYWRKLRLEHARKLLSNSNVYVTTIANECGFSDASHFILWFKKQYGETPYAYRKRRHGVDMLNIIKSI